MLNKRLWIAALGVVGACCWPALANQVLLGKASGGLMVYYNQIDNNGAGGVPDGVISGYDENPSNVAYYRAQFAYGNTNGMGFQFATAPVDWNAIFSGQPVGQSQFGFDLLIKAPTYNSSGGVSIPAFDFVDNVNNTVAGATHTPVMPPSPVAWAINDYKGSSPNGPGNPATSVINSLLRGTSATLTASNLQPTATGWTVDFAGELQSDMYIHWYNPAFPDTYLPNWQLTGKFFFAGTLAYNKVGDFGVDQKDFYAGDINIYAEIVPAPGAALLVLIGMPIVGWVKRRFA